MTAGGSSRQAAAAPRPDPTYLPAGQPTHPPSPCCTLLCSAVLQFGAFMQDIDLFDAAAYGLSSAEAAIMDPQHRLVLEAAAEALGASASHHTGRPGSAALFLTADILSSIACCAACCMCYMNYVHGFHAVAARASLLHP